MSRLRTRRLEASEALVPAWRARSRQPWSLAVRAGAAAGNHLDLGSRIALAADLQGTAGNAATAHLIGLARTDHRKDPPNGQKEIMDLGSGGQRGLTRTSYTANPPIFRAGAASQREGSWSTRPATVHLPSLDHEVYYPAPGRHLLRPYPPGSQYLEVTEEWSNRLLQGEGEHVDDIDRAWEMTWGRVASVINEMAAGAAFTGSTVEEAQAAAWREFKRRLPEGLRPDGDGPTTEAQEAKWGADSTNTIFRKLMGESKRARDVSGWHIPDQSLKAMEGHDRIDELSTGNSKIGQVTSDRLMQEAWDRVTRG
jgi:hypothetical protein